MVCYPSRYLERIATEVEILIIQNRKGIEKFKEKIKIFNKIYLEYREALEQQPVYTTPKGSLFTLLPNPLCWEIDDKLPCYYATLALVYDYKKVDMSQNRLCEGILDRHAQKIMLGLLTDPLGPALTEDDLNTALKLVKADLEAQQPGVVKPTEASGQKDTSEILIGIQKRIDFFRSKSDEFWQWNEDCLKTLYKYHIQQQGGHVRLEQQRLSGIELDAEITQQTDEKRDKLQAELKAKGWRYWTHEDLPRFIGPDLIGYPFYAPPDILYPALWLLNHHRTNNRKPNDQENFVLDCVLLSIAYDFDDETLESRESRIFRHDIGEGKYFDRREFCKDVAAKLKNRDGNKRIQRAWQRVIPRLPEPPTASGGKVGDNIQPTSETAKLKVEDIPDQVFIGYSHKDKRWLEDLQTHLKPYMRNRTLTPWSDKQITTGSKWLPEIKAALGRTKVGVLLVTPNFLASDFIHENELGPLLKKAEEGKVSIIWVPVGSCAYKETPLKDYQAAGDPDKPLATMKKADRDKAWVSICEEIKKAVSR